MVYVTSDWHGVPLVRIKELLDAAGFTDNDRLYILGDVIDRGEHGIALLKWLMLHPNMELLRGNHEDMMLGCDFLFDGDAEDGDTLDGYRHRLLSIWKRNGASPTIHALQKEPAYVRSDILRYLRHCPAYATVTVGARDFLLVHGGLREYHPKKRMEDYPEADLIWTRPDFFDEYSTAFTTIVGHTPTGYYGAEYAGRICRRPTWWDIDTGAAAGRMPMLLCLDTDKETYIEP